MLARGKRSATLATQKSEWDENLGFVACPEKHKGICGANLHPGEAGHGMRAREGGYATVARPHHVSHVDPYRIRIRRIERKNSLRRGPSAGQRPTTTRGTSLAEK